MVLLLVFLIWHTVPPTLGALPLFVGVPALLVAGVAWLAAVAQEESLRIRWHVGGYCDRMTCPYTHVAP